jgi:hypothetical protein
MITVTLPRHTNGDNRPGLHVHESQTGDQLPEDVDGDKKEGQVGDQPREDDADIRNPNIDAPDVVVEEDNNEDERAVPVGQAGDQPPEWVDWDKKEGQGVVQPPEFDADVSNPSIDAPAIIDEDDNVDAVPLEPNITPQFDSKDLYKVLGVPMNATERQIKSAYPNLAKKHHPDRQPNNLSKDDANRTIALINNAYEILWDTEKRRLHDASLPIGEVTNVDGEGNDDEDI